MRAQAADRAGETIYKGHRSYDLMLNLQLGIRHAVGSLASALAASGTSLPAQEFASKVSPCTLEHAETAFKSAVPSAICRAHARCQRGGSACSGFYRQEDAWGLEQAEYALQHMLPQAVCCTQGRSGASGQQRRACACRCACACACTFGSSSFSLSWLRLLTGLHEKSGTSRLAGQASRLQAQPCVSLYLSAAPWALHESIFYEQGGRPRMCCNNAVTSCG